MRFLLHHMICMRFCFACNTETEHATRFFCHACAERLSSQHRDDLWEPAEFVHPKTGKITQFVGMLELCQLMKTPHPERIITRAQLEKRRWDEDAQAAAESCASAEHELREAPRTTPIVHTMHGAPCMPCSQ